ncbi:Uncharacterised protein [Streptococcus suis]|uniref:Uncharacterized protein n=1 Tax=Streptococcus suis TaxID=1307 RepID=A0A0Z8IU17_STRSU|nr:Uncharacterised protein [Streptococcus suis]
MNVVVASLAASSVDFTASSNALGVSASFSSAGTFANCLVPSDAKTSASEVTCSRTVFASSTVAGVFTASETVAVVVAAPSVDLAVAVSVEAVVVVSEVAVFSSAFFTTLKTTFE